MFLPTDVGTAALVYWAWAIGAGVFLIVVLALLIQQAFDTIDPVERYRPEDDHKEVARRSS